MSIQQTIIFTFMILFLAGTLTGAGLWYHYSSEIDAKDRRIEVLTERRNILKRQLEGGGTGGAKGLRDQVDDAVEGLGRKLTEATELAARMKGDDKEGMEHRRVLYEDKQKEFEGKLPGAQAKWKALYEEWKSKDGEIETAIKQLKGLVVEAEQKTTESQTELERELANETTEKKKITEARKTFADDLGKTRADHESVLEKITEVARETRKAKTVGPQGHILFVDNALKTVTLDVGSEQGLRKGLQFDVYAKALAGLVKKGAIAVTAVRASSADALILPAQKVLVQDPVTGWVPPDPTMKYSVYAGGGQDESGVLELTKPRTREDRIAAYRAAKLEQEIGAEAASGRQKEQEEPSTPPSEVGKGFMPIMVGDWIYSQDFVPIVPEQVYQQQTAAELRAMQDVNLSSLTFFMSDAIRPYRREFLKRLIERNRCRVTLTMSADVNYVVTPPGMTDIEPLKEKLEATKDKEDAPAEIKSQRLILAALLEAKKTGAKVMAEDEAESFFSKRQRKTELLRVKTIQPGRSTFYVAGAMKERSVAQTNAYIRDHGGVPVAELEANVDYVVVGAGVDQAFFDKIKRLGLKILREDELPRFFGLE